MARKLSDLASKFKTAIAQDATAKDREESDRVSQEALENEAKAEARAARTELLDELAAFGKELGLTQKRNKKDNALTLGREAFALTFTPDGDASRLAVTYDGSIEDEHIRRIAQNDEPIWVLERASARFLLFDEGVEELLVRGLGLPRPEKQAAPPPAPRSTKKGKGTGDGTAVQDVLKQRRKEQRQNRPPQTKIIGKSHATWDVRPTNPALADVEAPERRPLTSVIGERTDVWDSRPKHTEKENPRRKRKFEIEDTIPGSTVKTFKPIL